MRQGDGSLVLIGIPVLYLGGTEVQTLNLVRVLISGGHRVAVCCYYDYDAAVVSVYRQAGAEVILMGLQRSRGAWALIGRLRAIIRNLRPDVVHIQYMAPGLLPILAARLAGARCILATVHQPGRTVGTKARWYLRTAALLCTRFFCVSQAAERSWFGDSQVFDPARRNGRRKHYTIYNAVDVDGIARLAGGVDVRGVRGSLGLGQGPVVGVVARVRHEKGHAVLLDALPHLLKNIPDAALLIVGDGPDRPALEGRAAALGVAGRVRWLGAVPQEEAFRLYGVMDVVAVPSLFEGFGLSAAEAMAAGRPVVASAVDGLAEVVEDGRTGWLVPPSDSAALAEKLIQLLSDPARARHMGLAGKERVQQRFSLARFSAATLGAYQAVLGGHDNLTR